MKTQAFSHVQLNAPRCIQRHLRCLARTGVYDLYLLRNPDGAGWVYVVPSSSDAITDLVVVSKPVGTRDFGRKDSKRRYGVVARELKIMDGLACPRKLKEAPVVIEPPKPQKKRRGKRRQKAA